MKNLIPLFPIYSFFCVPYSYPIMFNFISKRFQVLGQIHCWHAFGSLDSDASSGKQSKTYKQMYKDGDLFKQYKNNTGGSRYRWQLPRWLF